MPATSPFTPGSSILITVAATSAAITMPTTKGDQIVISSLAANAIAYVAFGSSVVIPTGTAANGFPILPGTVNVLTVPPGATQLSTIGTVANTLIASFGDGS